jgi:hypothetical protein
MGQHEAKSRLRMRSGGSKSTHLLQSQAGNSVARRYGREGVSRTGESWVNKCFISADCIGPIFISGSQYMDTWSKIWAEMLQSIADISRLSLDKPRVPLQ